MASETVVPRDSTSLLNVNMANVTKLTSSNFLMWRRQVQALLNGYDLTGYIDGSVTVPPATLTNNAADHVNPAYKHWQRQDQLIYSALLGAISISVQPILSRTTTSAEIRSKLVETYANPSRSHVQQIRQQIKLWRKDNKSVDEYFQGLVMRLDQLALLGKPMETEEQMESIVEGLSEDYKQVIDQIQGREVPPSFSEIHEKLLNHEIKLQAMAAATPSLPISANVASYRPQHNHKNNNSSNYRGQNRNNNNNRGTHPNQPRNDQNASRGYQGKCQICGVYGHSARRCSPISTPTFQYRGSHALTWRSCLTIHGFLIAEQRIISPPI